MKNSFRKEQANAFRFGLVLNGISDHFPIQIKANFSGNMTYSMSWNLLADIHLYNDFKDISGSHFFEESILKASSNNIYFNKNNKNLYYFFSELAQFSYTKCVENMIIITDKLLDDFVLLENQDSKLSQSKNPKVAKEKSQQVEASRKMIIGLLKDRRHPHAHDFQKVIKQCIELIHHIQSPKGVLRWKSRFQLIKHNKSLVNQMINSDFICLQECTNPADIYNLLITNSKSLKMLCYAVDKNTTDHCVLLYDDSKFNLVYKPIYHALDGKKPCIFVRFESRATNHKVIVASIHHPGGNCNYLNQLFTQVNQLKTGEFSEADFMIIGDYNHTQDFFKTHRLQFQLCFPKKCTMVGPDFGNINCAVDAVMTNLDEKSLRIRVIEGLPISPPAHYPVKVIFQLKR